ncbi:MAG: TfoX/Sxy family protein [Bacteroidetes bacterium]|nr:TfoX/Sxy family protein [Bacteroidota bacterium]
MPYNQELADRTIEIISSSSHKVEIKKMFGGICFMVNDKMLGGVVQDRLMIRHDPDRAEELLNKEGCRPMDFTGKPMKGMVYVDLNVLQKKEQLEYWLNVAMEFNTVAKKSNKVTK